MSISIFEIILSYYMKEYVDFRNAADLSDAEKDMIYGGSAAGILGI